MRDLFVSSRYDMPLQRKPLCCACCRVCQPKRWLLQRQRTVRHFVQRFFNCFGDSLDYSMECLLESVSCHYYERCCASRVARSR